MAGGIWECWNVVYSQDERHITGFGAPGRQLLNLVNLIGLTPTCLARLAQMHKQHTDTHLYCTPISPQSEFIGILGSASWLDEGAMLG